MVEELHALCERWHGRDSIIHCAFEHLCWSDKCKSNTPFDITYW